jgi:hypothetical protein
MVAHRVGGGAVLYRPVHAGQKLELALIVLLHAPERSLAVHVIVNCE